MKAKAMAENKRSGRRQIKVELELQGGYRHKLSLSEDSPELQELFRAFASRSISAATDPGTFLQLPLDKGRAACTFLSSDLVSVVTRPPVLIEPQVVDLGPVLPGQQLQREEPGSASVRPPRHAIVDDFLSPSEQNDMLAYALQNSAKFEKGTVTTTDESYRRNLVIMDFANSAHATLIVNRLLVLYPVLMKKLGRPLVPLSVIESQLTASNDGHYFKGHQDSGTETTTATRLLSFVYYFHREPKGYAGGDLRLFDTVEQAGQQWPGSSFIEVEPRANRLVVFPSETFHELTPIRCSSREFADSRFAVTTWFRRSDEANPATTFGWGHFHCGVVPAT